MGSSLHLCLEWFFTLPGFCLVGPDIEGGFLSKCQWSPPSLYTWIPLVLMVGQCVLLGRMAILNWQNLSPSQKPWLQIPPSGGRGRWDSFYLRPMDCVRKTDSLLLEFVSWMFLHCDYFNYKEIKTTLNRLFWKVKKAHQTALLYGVVFVQYVTVFYTQDQVCMRPCTFNIFASMLLLGIHNHQL